MRSKLIFFVVLVFSVSLVLGTGSDSGTTVNIGGCDIEFDGNVFAVAVDTCYTKNDSYYGMFYCDNEHNGWVTTAVGEGCSMRKSDFAPGDVSCCPEEMFCNDTGAGFQCVSREKDCIEWDNSRDCKAASCWWSEIEELCFDSSKGYTCEFYDNEEYCGDDAYDLWQNSDSSGMCSGSSFECEGVAYTVNPDNCGCGWYPEKEEGKKCQFKAEAYQSVTSVIGKPNRLSCSLSYDRSDCIDGERVSNRTALFEEESDSTLTPIQLARCAEEAGCIDLTSVSNCGKPIIKLPGFSFFSAVGVVLIIGMSYFFKERRKF